MEAPLNGEVVAGLSGLQAALLFALAIVVTCLLRLVRRRLLGQPQS